MTTVGIFGFGRIGRKPLPNLHARQDIRIGGISDLAEPEGLAYLLKFDTLLGRFPEELSIENGSLVVGGRRIPLLSGKDQPAVPKWGELGVDTVLEATSRGRTRAEAEAHLAAGARARILLAPPRSRPTSRPSGRQRRPPPAGAPHRVQRVLAVHCLAPSRRSCMRLSASGVRSSPRSTPTRARTGLPTSGRGQAPRTGGRREHHSAQYPRSPGQLLELLPELVRTAVLVRDERAGFEWIGRDLVFWHVERR